MSDILANQCQTLAHGTVAITTTGVPTYTGATLTASYVYSGMIPLQDNGTIEVDAAYTAGQVSGTIKCDIIVDISPDSFDVPTASSKWINVGTISNTSGTLTFTQSTLKIVSGASEVTNQWILNTQGKKFRIGIKEEGSPSPFGTVIVWATQKLFQ